MDEKDVCFACTESEPQRVNVPVQYMESRISKAPAHRIDGSLLLLQAYTNRRLGVQPAAWS